MYPYNQQIIRVNGENEARAYTNTMMLNSSVILADTTDSLIWLCQTDSAGNRAVTPFKIEPYVPPEPIDVNALLERIKELEDKINEQSTTRQVKRSSKNREPESTIQSDDED